MTYRRLSLAAAMLLLAGLAGCGGQPTVVSKYVPVPLAVQPAPPSTLTMVGTGDTPEAARKAAIDQLVYKVILPPTEPSNQPPPGFVETLIRGYNIKSTERDLTGRYYVTLELSLNQIGTNFQELYHANETMTKENDLCRDKAEDERAHRQIAEEKEKDALKRLEQDKKDYTSRILVLEQEIDRLRHPEKKP